MPYRVLLVRRFASLESHSHESYWLESLPRVYATVVDKSH